MCNKEQLVSYVYEELGADERVQFEAHLSGCAECRQELAGLRGTRQQLAGWAPPQPEFNFHIVRGAAAPAVPAAPKRRLAFVPQWALNAAAALLLLAGAAAIANVELRYGPDGVSVRTGWGKAAPATPATVAPAGDMAQAASATAASEQLMQRVEALTAKLRELEEAQAVQARVAAPARAVITAPELRRILAELESRQRTEMALQVSQVWKDFTAARVTDYTRLQDVVSRAQGMTNQQLKQHRDSIETLYRTASQR